MYDEVQSNGKRGFIRVKDKNSNLIAIGNQMAIANKINIASQFSNRVICPCGFRDGRIEKEKRIWINLLL